VRSTQESLAESSFLFLGAGEAGTGIAELLSTAIAQESGKTVEEARKQVWLADSKGLITNKRDLAKLAHHKLPFAHQPPQKLMRRLSASAASSSGGGVDDSDEDLDFLAAIQAIRPAGIVGVSAQPQSFTKDMVEAMCDNNDRPIVFALSNPTSKAECTAEQAYEWSGGKAIFASGSPFDPVTMPDGTVRVPGQGNNAYIFPAVGMGCLVSGSTQVTDSMFLIAAQRLASLVTKKDLEMGLVYPQLGRLREVSLIIAAAVAEEAYRLGFASRTPKPDNLLSAVKAAAWQPTYRSML
jgi:malate dehydrogenase (oxaloacetate-decarboxylating)(NADP+)